METKDILGREPQPQDTDDDAYLDEDEGILELEDEDGNVQRFEFVDKAEMNGIAYYALVPADYEEDEDDGGNTEFVVLKEAMVDGEVMLATVDDDDEYNAAGEMFIQRFSELIDSDDFD